MQKINPFLWFNNDAEDAVKFYTSVFQNSKIGGMACYDEAGAEAAHMPKGTVMTVSFQLEGQEFAAINGGPIFKFTPAISFMVNCKTAYEVEELWKKLSDGGTALMPLDKYPFSEKYGWIQDKYGLSWQLITSPGGAPQKIIPSMMFVGKVAGKAEDAINFYTSIFKNAKVGSIFRYGAGQLPDKEGTVMFADFALEGQQFAAMDSAREHNFNFNEAISFVVYCNTQDEIEYYWKKLSAVPESEQCGWLKDKYGVSWQIIPTVLIKYLGDKDANKSRRVMKAMLQMKKIEIKKLEEAYGEK